LVYLYRRDRANRWQERARLEPADTRAQDHFGQTLAADGDRLLVGAPVREGAGAVYVFERDRAGTWRQTAKLEQPEGAVGFGSALALRGDWAFVGAPGQDGGQGEVHLFRRGAERWEAAGTARPQDARRGDRFGVDIAVAERRVVIGAAGRGRNSGVAYVFALQDSGLSEEARLAPADTTPNNRFGQAVALDGDVVFLGGPGFDRNAGAVVTFRRDSTGRWQEEAMLRPFDRTPFKQFGAALAVAGDDVWIGAPFSDESQGRIYRVRRDTSGAFTEVVKIGTANQQRFDQLGRSLAVVGTIAVVGRTGDDDGAGSAMAYERTPQGAWVERARLASPPFSLPAVTGTQRQCQEGAAATFRCEEVDLQAFLPISAIGGRRGVRLNDIWGWVDPETRREYALVGRTDGTAFVDVTDPANPIYVGQLPKTDGSPNAAWRDIKVYRNHAFIVADASGRHGMQVFDLTQLRGVRNPPVTFRPTAHYTGINSAHNIVINEESGFAFAVGSSGGGETCGGGLHMIDIRTPTNPTFAGCFADPQTGRASTGYSHDAQCVVYRGPDAQYRGREICFGSNETALSIADVTDKGRPVAIARAGYPNVAYSHQGWLSEDHRYFYMDDEGDELSGTVPGTRTIVWDVSDLDDPVVAYEFIAPVRSSDHNLYVKGRYVYQSNYASGLRVLDISEPARPRLAGFFDTVPWGDDAPGFNGSWSNYPFFPSGNIVVTSIGEGLFVVRHRAATPVP
jgi:choice-of-anchor B domain-containing protein